jgi:signal transduction histidine kinase/HAMP domain-containing protein
MTTIETPSLNWKERLRRFTGSSLEKRWLNVGLRAKMGLIVEVGVIGLVTVFLFLGVSAARQTTQQILNERMMLARLSAANLDAAFRHVRSVLELSAGSDAFRLPGMAQAERRALMRMAHQRMADLIQGVYWLDAQGKVLASTATKDRLQAIPLEGLGAQASHPPQLVLSPAGVPLAVIRSPILSEAGEAQGWLAATMDLSSAGFAPFHNAIDLGKTGSMDLIDAQGRVLISSRRDRPMNAAAPQDLQKLFRAGEPMVETCLGCSVGETPESSEEVAAIAPLTQAPWGVVVRQKASELMAPVNRLLIQTLTFGLVSVLGAMALVWVTTSSVIKPVQMLKESVERIKAGDLSTPLEELFTGWFTLRRRRQDEIGALAESFETMRQQLQRSIEEINALNRELDQRVQERTRDALAAQMQAQAARDDLRAIIDALDDELIVVRTSDLRIELANRAAMNYSGSVEEILGQTCYQGCRRASPCDPGINDCPIPRVLETGETVRVTHVLDGRNGHEPVYREITASPLRDVQGAITRVVELSRDVSEERKIKESLIRRNQQLSILNAVAATVNQSLKLEEILERALDAVLNLTQVDVGAVFLIEEQDGQMRLASYRGLSEEAARVAATTGLLDSSCGGVIEHGRVVVVPDIARFHGRRARSLQRENLNTLVHVPLTAKGCVLGSMCVGTRQDREFAEDDQELLQAIGSQIAVAIENARLYEEGQIKERMRSKLFKKAINAQEEERRRIARELHDETSQSLTALLFAAEEACEMRNLKEVRHRLEGMRDLLQHTLDGVHKLIFDLRPSMLDHLGLVPAIRWLAKSRLEPKGVRLHFEERGGSRRLAPEVETAIFRVIQEAVSNISRHAAARNVLITYEMSGENVLVCVEDDGVGFDPLELNPSPDSLRGLGLLGMQERLELLGGDLEIHSSPGSGTRLNIRMPVGNGRAVDA